MVLIQNYLDIIEKTLKNNSLGSFTLPSVKESFLQISYEKSDGCSTIYYNEAKPVLPFARSDQYLADITSWRRLSAVDNNCKDVYEIDLDITDSKFTFNPGDTIGIIPRNIESEVNTVIKQLCLEDVKNMQYSLSIEQGRKAKVPNHIPVKSTIEYVLTHCVDLRGVVKKLFLLALSRHTKDETERKVLEYLCSKEGSTMYGSDILNKNICLLDLLCMFKTCKPPIQVIFEHLPKLLPRPYSVANSSSKHPNLIKICFSVMDIRNQRKGLTTGWLEQLILNDSLEMKMKELNLNKDFNYTKVPIYIRQNVNGFSLPTLPETPLILIGPGTGVSPFIGFLQEREHIRNNLNKHLGTSWLFFGCRNPTLDYLYEEEIKNFLDTGILSNLTEAFSRIDDYKIKYVQDGLKENAAVISKLIKKGTYLYICGDGNIVASQVKEAIKECLVSHDNMSEQEAERYINGMQKEKRYITDIWN